MSGAPLLSAFRQSFSEAWSGGAGLFLPAAFFAGASILVPISVSAEGQLLSEIGLGVIWVTLALSSLVTMERLFQADLEDGALDLWLQTNAPISAIAAAKTLAHWCVAGLPLAIIVPVLGLMLQVPPDKLLPAALAYGVGGLSFFFWGGVGAALAAGVRRGGLLIALLALPFYVPTAIFGALTVQSGGLLTTNGLLLIATTLFALGVTPPAMGAALRLAAD